MNKKISTLLALGLLALTACSPAASSTTSVSEPSGSETPTNPEESEMNEDLTGLDQFAEEERATYDNHFAQDDRLPGVSAVQCADPFVLRHDGRYYLYATSGGNQLLCWESDDLLHWERAGNNGNCLGGTSLVNPWAPEVTYINGKFYLISSFGGQKHSVLVSDSPTGPFVDYSTNIFQNCIDGSFFIDSDEQVYCTIASSLGIFVKRFTDDLKDFKNDRFEVTYANTKLGRWNEGPYITKRSGRYYLTWTGVDCYAPSYRVNYNYFDGESVTSIANSNAFKQKGGSILLSTDESYMGLGHSANFVGPDLDSLYVGYHDLALNYGPNGESTSNRRYFNFARLSFNGSRVVSDTGNDKEGNFVPRQPDFASRGGSGMKQEGTFLLSEASHGTSFTAEWNAKGENGKYVFGYTDSSNYGYVTASNANGLEVHVVKDGTDAVVGEAELNKDYDFNALHTYRLSYDQGQYNLYFDEIEKISLGEANLPAGRYGYEGKDSASISYSAFSNSGLGSSDALEYQKNQSLANAYDRENSVFDNGSRLAYYEEEFGSEISDNDIGYMNLEAGDRASYLMHADTESTAITLKVHSDMSGKQVGIRINDGEKTVVTIPEIDGEGFHFVDLGLFPTEVGRNRVSLYSESDTLQYSELAYEAATDTSSYRFESGLRAYNQSLTWVDHGRDRIEYTSEGMHSKGVDNDFVYIKDREDLGDVSIEADVAVNEEISDKFAHRRNALGSLTMDALDIDLAYGAGIALRVDNHEYYYGGPNFECCIDNLQGVYFGMNADKVFVKDANYAETVVVYEKEHSFPLGEKHHLKLESLDGVVTAYLDGEKLISFRPEGAPSRGKVGLYSFYTDSTYENLVVEGK